MRVTILLDASGSMAYSGDKATSLGGRECLSKFDYGRYLAAAALTYLLIRQQDAVGLVIFADGIKRYLRPTAKPSQVRAIFEELSSTQPTEDTRCADSHLSLPIRSKGLVADLEQPSLPQSEPDLFSSFRAKYLLASTIL